MIAISLRPTVCDWSTMSFCSTLFLSPILDLLLARIPLEWREELRLGLQEALVNAAKHGNKLDPGKTVVVQFSAKNGQYSWLISDQGSGFQPNCCCSQSPKELLPLDDSENGRGICILHQIFDQVHWNSQGTQLMLCKQVKGKKPWQPSTS